MIKQRNYHFVKGANSDARTFTARPGAAAVLSAGVENDAECEDGKV